MLHMAEKKGRILIVDDNIEIHEDFKKILIPVSSNKDSETLALEADLFGPAAVNPDDNTDVPVYDIDDAYQGEEALAKVEKASEDNRPYGLVFMDIRMPPGIDGIETINRIWKKYPQTEIVICTAYSDYSWDQILKKFGSNDHLLFVKKPFDSVMVKQIALTLTTKWLLDKKNRDHLRTLESEVEKRTVELRSMMVHLSELKDIAEAATRAKSEFLANMSHEIRTPMNAVIGFGELLKETHLSSQQKDYVDTICESGGLLIALINDILDISKIESKKVELEEIDFNLEYLIGSILKILRQRVGSKPVDLNLLYPEDIQRDFKGDPTRIRQIFMNITGNAIKFTDKGDVTIRVEVESFNSNPIDPKSVIRLFVRDTGIGIPKEKQADIFEAFSQVDSSTTRKYGGTGLGLAIARSLVSMMGGTIEVRSEVDRGSEFIFTVCLRHGKPTIEKEIKLVDLESCKGKNVLIVDDNRQSREILNNYCNLIQMNVVCCTDSAYGALEWLKNEANNVDLVLSDIMMPVMDGNDLAKEIRRLDRHKTTKLVALTSDAVPGIAEQSSAAGFDAFISKPFTKKELFEIIRTVFGDSRKEKDQIVTRHLAQEVLIKGIEVLVAEDNTLNQKLMGILLKQLGCVYEMVGNGTEAIAKLNEKKFDLILMDIQMPVMDGLEATNQIRKNLKLETPIIALTARVLKEDEDQCKAVGMNDFLSKPINPNKLKEIIYKWAQK